MQVERFHRAYDGTVKRNAGCGDVVVVHVRGVYVGHVPQPRTYRDPLTPIHHDVLHVPTGRWIGQPGRVRGGPAGELT